MLSIITCTTNMAKAETLGFNIQETIGTEYEFLPYDNSESHYSLSKVYNFQSVKCRYKYICFVHDDIRFITQDWGKALLSHFLTEEKTGLIGVAGASYKTVTPSMWSKVPAEFLSANIIQHFKYTAKPYEHFFWKNTDKYFYDAVTIDGVFMATKKEILNLYSFDETLLKGFHCYDLDFSLQVLQSHRVQVSYNILLEHYSEGKSDYNWLISHIFISKKWKKFLPKSLYPLSKLEKDRLEYAAMFTSLSILTDSGKGYISKINFFLKYFRFSYLLLPFIKTKIDERLKNKMLNLYRSG